MSVYLALLFSVSHALSVFCTCRYLDKPALLSAIENVAFPGGEVESVFSVTNLLTSFVTAAVSQRSDAIMIAICITDGAPNTHNAVGVAAVIALHAIGMNLCMVCVTDRCPEDLAKSASSPPKEASHEIIIFFECDPLNEEAVC